MHPRKYLNVMILIRGHDIKTLSNMPVSRVLIDLCKKMIQLGHLVAWRYFKRLQELYLSPFCGITAGEIARFENGSTVVNKKYEIARFVLKITRYCQFVPFSPLCGQVLSPPQDLRDSSCAWSCAPLARPPRRISGWPT